MDQISSFRWCCPDGGPAANPQKLVEWANANLLDARGIFCAARDLAALQSSLLGPRVHTPESGLVQPGTVWVVAA